MFCGNSFLIFFFVQVVNVSFDSLQIASSEKKKSTIATLGVDKHN
jgi:hypothetical protein